jgi:putative ABC transport system substrate-binding protein
MKRRDFLMLAGAAGAAAAFPRVGLAQAARNVPRVALVSNGVPPADMTETGDVRWAAFIQEMARLGYVEGKTVVFDRYIVPAPAATISAGIILGAGPDLVFTGGAGDATLAMMAHTKTTPIVCLTSDPVGQGMVTNLAHPGGNVTSISTTAGPEADGKNLELLAQAVPTARRVVYYGPGVGGQPPPIIQMHEVAARGAAQSLGLEFINVTVEDVDEAELSRAFGIALAAKPDIIQFGIGPQNSIGAPVLAKLALDARIPAISPNVAFAKAGGMLSQGSNGPDNRRKAAGYVALILQGAQPGDLPVLLPTEFDFIVNLKTARAIGVAIPPSILLQATEVIE